MSLYDQIQFECPTCQTSVTVQSKAGDCDMATYPESAVPAHIALALTGHSVTCSNCGSVLQLEPEAPIQPVRMKAVVHQD